MKKIILLTTLMIMSVLMLSCANNAFTGITMEATQVIDLRNSEEAVTPTPKVKQFDLPKDFTIKQVIKKENSRVEWDGRDYRCSLELLIGEDSRAILSFRNRQDRVMHTLKSDNPIMTGYIYDENNIFLVSHANDKLLLKSYNYFGKNTKNYEFNNFKQGEDYKIIASDVDSFYLTYSLNKQIHIDSFKINNQELSLISRDKLRPDIVNIFSDKNTIFLQRQAKKGDCIDILNKKLAVLDIVKIGSDNEVLDIKYEFDTKNDFKSVSNLNIYLQNEDKVMKQTIPQRNNYNTLYTHTVFENKELEYNSKNELHYIVFDYYRGVFENGCIVEMNFPFILDNNYGDINYLQLPNGKVVKTNEEYDYCSLLIAKDNDIAKMLKIDNYYIGLNRQDEVTYIDPDFKDCILNETFIGVKLTFGQVFFNKETNKVYYFKIQNNSMYLYSINSSRETELVLDIPDNIWRLAVNVKTMPYKFFANDLGVALLTENTYGYRMCYYDFTTKKWQIFKKDTEIRKDKSKIYYEIGDLQYCFNQETKLFEPMIFQGKEYYNCLTIDDKIYVDAEYSSIENDSNCILYNSPYIEYKIGNENFKITDYQTIANHTIVKQYKTANIYSIEDDSYQKLIDTAVRRYSISEQGILYTGFENDVNLYYYDFETKQLNILYEGLVYDLALKNNFAYFIAIEDKNKLVKLNITNGQKQVSKLSDTELSFQIGDNYLALSSKDFNYIKIFSLSDLELVDTIDGFYFIWSEDKLYYSCGGYLVRYNALKKTMTLIDYITYPFTLTIKDNYLYYLCFYDADVPLCRTNLNKEIILPRTKTDYLLIEMETDYLQRLLLYNVKEKRISEIICSRSVDYKIKGSTIHYKGKGYNENNDWQQLKLKEGSVITIVDKKDLSRTKEY
ncbi:hypothetical protein IMX26_13805 [Clostridium sp. 'deep sea']|uniref:hypothetical protein n=1 Tax=Clostridium sp. 'deep sea' TaxID=2779445 RepID=UPI0018969390|nr:hypothetical protein [Clostridium sp. 'deep sea']QOR34540.1 hypothetical protein IMX26_13805 [Clostridium sp. 'deep sea']